MGAAKRLGNKLINRTSGSRTSERESLRAGSGDLGAGDGMVAMGTSTTGSGREVAGMSSKVMCSLRLYPRCWWTKESWVGAGRRFSFSSLR